MMRHFEQVYRLKMRGNEALGTPFCVAGENPEAETVTEYALQSGTPISEYRPFASVVAAALKPPPETSI